MKVSLGQVLSKGLAVPLTVKMRVLEAGADATVAFARMLQEVRQGAETAYFPQTAFYLANNRLFLFFLC